MTELERKAAYRAKEIMWAFILLTFLCLSLTGCSSTPKQTTARPYCNTSQEIRTKNGTNVSSETVVKCNDDPIEQIVIKKAGMAQNCGWVSNPITLPGGRTVNEAYISCLASNGRWVRIDAN